MDVLGGSAGTRARRSGGRLRGHARTPQDDADDKISKGRQARWERNGNAKLTEALVLEIRMLRTVTFFTEVLGFKKLMDLNPGAFLSNGRVGLGIGPHPEPARAIPGDRFDENRIGLDHLSFGVASRADLEHAVRVLDTRGVAHSEIRDLGPAFGIYVLIFRDPDNIQLELSAPHVP